MRRNLYICITYSRFWNSAGIINYLTKPLFEWKNVLSYTSFPLKAFDRKEKKGYYSRIVSSRVHSSSQTLRISVVASETCVTRAAPICIQNSLKHGEKQTLGMRGPQQALTFDTRHIRPFPPKKKTKKKNKTRPSPQTQWLSLLVDDLRRCIHALFMRWSAISMVIHISARPARGEYCAGAERI